MAVTIASLGYRPPPRLGASSERPTWALVLCSLRNEAAQLDRFLSGLADASADHGAVEILLVDDHSTDDTPLRLQAAAKTLPRCTVIALRGGAPLGKGGALRAALDRYEPGDAEIAVCLDADHVLEPGALRRLADYYADPQVGGVALRHVPEDSSGLIGAYCFLEGAVQEEVTSRGQHALGWMPKLAGAWSTRVELLREYQPDVARVLNEDVQFTRRLLLAGYRIAYAADVRTIHRVPTTFRPYFRQHVRWAEAYYRLMRPNVRAVVGLTERRSPASTLDSIITMIGYLDRPIIVLELVTAARRRRSRVGRASASIPALAIGAQIAVGLWLAKAPPRLALRSLASLVLAWADVVAAIWAGVRTLRQADIVWSTER